MFRICYGTRGPVGFYFYYCLSAVCVCVCTIAYLKQRKGNINKYKKRIKDRVTQLLETFPDTPRRLGFLFFFGSAASLDHFIFRFFLEREEFSAARD